MVYYAQMKKKDDSFIRVRENDNHLGFYYMTPLASWHLNEPYVLLLFLATHYHYVTKINVNTKQRQKITSLIDISKSLF